MLNAKTVDEAIPNPPLYEPGRGPLGRLIRSFVIYIYIYIYIYILPFGFLWPPLGVFGTPLAFPRPTLASVLTLWGGLGLPLGVLSAPLDPFGLPLASLWLSLATRGY